MRPDAAGIPSRCVTTPDRAPSALGLPPTGPGPNTRCEAERSQSTPSRGVSPGSRW